MSAVFKRIIDYPDYEISSYPFTIRNIETKEIIPHELNDDGFITVKFGNTIEYLHHLVSTQFHGKQKRARRVAEYTNTINENCIELFEYKNVELKEYYYDETNDQVYLRSRNRYKLIKPLFNGTKATITLMKRDGGTMTADYYKFIHELHEWCREN